MTLLICLFPLWLPRSWLQCCWFFLSHSGAATGPRAVLRYGQLAAAALGVAMLLPGSGWYGSSLVGSSITGIAGEYDTAYGSVTGSTPGSGGVSYTLLWQMGIGAAKGGSWAGSGSGAGAGVESLVDADVHHELIRLQVRGTRDSVAVAGAGAGFGGCRRQQYARARLLWVWARRIAGV